ncbi:MAG TPA: phosphoribosylformylglycinamidine synthase subunit PurL [Vicinamibacterales bacterium]|nr:phosphoribosylformylglycinamidine synthase subunit PurL [Vicinamibacterales bacterium]
MHNGGKFKTGQTTGSKPESSVLSVPDAASTIDVAVLERHGIKPDEYDRMVELMGREPNLLELGMFSVMWSEHCSYKSSRVHLKTLPTTGPRVVQGPGENAGAVDIGDDMCAVFKIESHNHPSFIEPYQGAATGVGGIIRDIFTMGARPIALLNALRFGSLDTPLARRIFEGVVAGIGGYGNSIGIPTIAGEIYFDPKYAGNPLVNVLCLGLARRNEIVKGAAKGDGNPVFYVGAKTGRDGIHGATMASAEFDETSAEKRPAVQVGDPFMEKLLMEACLEVMRTGAIVGIQDMGAAGLTCATSEMSSRGGTGMEVEVTLVPQRESAMIPYEIMLSESQERMLLVVEKGRERDVEEVFEKWDLHAEKIGTVTATGRVKVFQHGTLVADVPARALTDEGPVYRRPMAEPDWQRRVQQLPFDAMGTPVAPSQAFDALIASPVIASKRWAYRQYDHTVGTNTIAGPGASAGVVRVKGTTRALAVSVDGNGRFCYLDPYRGAMLAVAESARNVACSGGEPIGATNNLNFGNPERPEIMWQLAEAIRGIGDACRFLEIPVTGGNVSLYNETEGEAIYPTPVLGVVGLIEDATKTATRLFRSAGARVILLGDNRGELGGSEYLARLHNTVAGAAPHLDLARERALQQLVVRTIREGLIESAHDCAEGGLAVTLAECCFETPLGVAVDVPSAADAPSDFRVNATLFGESASRVVVSVRPEHEARFRELARELGVPVQAIGETGGARITLKVDGTTVVDVAAKEAETRWLTAIETLMELAGRQVGR